MFGQTNRTRDRNTAGEGESRRPLLGGFQEDRAEERTVFAVDDSSDDESEGIGALSPKGDRPDHTVRFQEDVQVIAPPLRSTTSSREAGMYVSITMFR